MNKEILNEMSVDELRNYICHLKNMEDRFGELNYVKDEVIECFQRLCNKQSTFYDYLARYTAAQGKVHKIEEEMYLKYQDVLPTPTMGVTEGEI